MRVHRLAVPAIAAALVACAPALQEREPPRTAAGEPTIAAGPDRYDVDPSASRVIAEVHRAGSLARFGHDHVIASHAVRGAIDALRGEAALAIDVADLVVDEPALREAAGLGGGPSAEDVAGTYANMLRVMRADMYPTVHVRVQGAGDRAGERTVAASVTIAGVTRPVDTALRVGRTVDAISVDGTLSLRQTDFGLVPFSLLGGALRVEDAVAVRFTIVARRASG